MHVPECLCDASDVCVARLCSQLRFKMLRKKSVCIKKRDRAKSIRNQIIRFNEHNMTSCFVASINNAKWFFVFTTQLETHTFEIVYRILFFDDVNSKSTVNVY